MSPRTVQPEAGPTVTFDVVQESGEGNEIARERLTTADDQDMIDNAISEQLESWILSIGDIIRIVEVDEQPRLANKAMQRKLDAGTCVNVSECPRLGPYYVLEEFEDGMDYADKKLEAWVWSIGRAERACTFMHDGTEHVVAKGVILVSLASDLYQRPGFECLFLR